MTGHVRPFDFARRSTPPFPAAVEGRGRALELPLQAHSIAAHAAGRVLVPVVLERVVPVVVHLPYEPAPCPVARGDPGRVALHDAILTKPFRLHDLKVGAGHDQVVLLRLVCYGPRPRHKTLDPTGHTVDQSSR